MTRSTIPAPALELIPRVHAAARAGVGDLAPSTMRIPNAHYTDPAILEAELRTTFAAPLLVAPSSSVPKPGDYRAMDLMGTPVVVVRGADGRARVLLNVCRHRGAQIAEGSGCSRRLTCAYHGWTYDTEGALVGIPGREGFDDIDVATHGLVELPSEERHGYVWAPARPGRRPRPRRPPRSVRRRAGRLGLPLRRRRVDGAASSARTGSARSRRSWRPTTSRTSTAARWSAGRPWPTSSRSTRSAATTASACRPSPWAPTRNRPRASTSSSSTTSTPAP